MEEHEIYCDDENCPCRIPPASGKECLYDRGAITKEGDQFCSDWCAASYAAEHDLPYIEEKQVDY